MRKMKTERSEYEKKNGLVARAELSKNVERLLVALDDQEFHAFYRLIWTMSALKTINKCRGVA
jgi:hypothetical protein